MPIMNKQSKATDTYQYHFPNPTVAEWLYKTKYDIL